MTYGTVDNNADIIDSRDVIARIEELEELLRVSDPADSEGDYEQLQEELETLQNFAIDGENNVEDWKYGATLIRDSYFTEYAEQLAGEIGAIDPNAGWPLAHIDWDAAAEALKIDYTEIEFDGETYYAR
jgi:hypothetical protein